ncbi:hypothetical protein OX284_010075 [Flavobacterium sp. SUN046]|uniref:hypothetical protein n=1 Tax=Flavobacterium sp. SUN046 TaxID=3002440 RepID=UPI002DBCD1FF|nr:hypothetical protein [Flavobacterium sp. SUN046]MEC4049774.1 hypothetical protein [Flavobacterium sp. SUN046]
MKLENLGLGALRVLEMLGELEMEHKKLKESNSNVQKWWQEGNAKVKELEEKIADLESQKTNS